MAPRLDNPESEPASSSRTATQTLRLRIVSSAFLLPIMLLVVHIGFPAFDILMLMAAMLMAREWARLTSDDHALVASLALGAAVLIITALAVAGLDPRVGALITVGISAGLYLYARFAGWGTAPWFATGAIAIGVPCMAFEWLRNDPYHGRDTVYWILIVVWATDSGAYAFGRLIGGPKLAPRISPNKTWAGLVGGMACAALAGAIAAPLLGAANVPLAAAASGALAIVAQAGDLGESVLKRHFGVKDTGGLIPGHGGLLDRVDGLLAVVPMVALITWATGASVLDWP
jgi:phosphatidate cytidylyltransferase